MVRELELFLLTFRLQTSSGQPSPLPELLPSSPGEERRLGQAVPTQDPECHDSVYGHPRLGGTLTLGG